MTTTSFTEMSINRSNRSRGFMRTVLDRVVEARSREARRYVEGRLTLMGADHFDTAVRESLFDGRTPERR